MTTPKPQRAGLVERLRTRKFLSIRNQFELQHEAADTIELLADALRSAIGAMEVLGHPENYGALAKARAALSSLGGGGRA